MDKCHSWPDHHWNWPITINHKHGVRCGSMIWVGGQVDLTPDGVVRNRGDIEAQTGNAMAYLVRVLEDLDCVPEDLVTLLIFYVNDGSLDETDVLAMVARHLPDDCRLTVNAVPVPWLAYEGLMIEIEGYAMRRRDGAPTLRDVAPAGTGSPLAAPWVEGLRSDDMIFVSAQYPVNNDGRVAARGDIVAQTRLVMERAGRVLDHFGAGFDDAVKINRWYAGGSGIADFEAAALACAAHFREPGPAATGVPIPRHADREVLIKISMVAMLGEDGEHLERTHVWPDSLWDWHVHLPYKHGLKCQDMIFLGGQVSLDRKGEAVHPNDLSRQTHQAMTHIGTILEALGAGYDDVCKVTTVYKGDCGAEALNANLPIRSSYFRDPGPASTGVPLPVLAYDSMVIEIDVFAMKESS